MRQQRTSALRRVKPNWRGAQFATFDWQVASYAGSEIVLAIYYLEGPSNVPLERMAMAGVPAFWSNELGGQASSAVLGDGTLTVTMPDPIVTPFTLNLSANDPALRGDQGEYLCGKQLYYQEPCPPVPVGLAWQFNTFSGADVVLDVLGVQGSLVNNFPVPFRDDTTSEFLSAMSAGGVQITLSFPTTPSSGDTLSLENPSLGVRDADGNWIAAGSLIIP